MPTVSESDAEGRKVQGIAEENKICLASGNFVTLWKSSHQNGLDQTIITTLYYLNILKVLGI